VLSQSNTKLTASNVVRKTLAPSCFGSSATNSASKVAGKTSAAQLYTTDVHMVNRAVTSLFGQVIPRLLQASAWVTIVLCLGIYILCVVVFAALFFWLGPDCFNFAVDPDDWSFTRVLWLSVHTFSTVGYGSAHPTCAAAEVLVLAESFVQLVLTFWFSGFTIFAAMRPRSRVRFSKHYLLSPSKDTFSHPDGQGGLLLVLRLVRESPHALRDAKVTVQAVIKSQLPDGSLTSHSAELKIPSNVRTSLEVWEVAHPIVEGSPLWEIRNNLDEKLTGIEVSLCVYDTAYMQEVRLYTSYAVDEFVKFAQFDSMASLVPSQHGGIPMLVVDHSKLDTYTKEAAIEMGRCSRKAFGISKTLRRLGSSGNMSMPGYRRKNSTGVGLFPRSGEGRKTSTFRSAGKAAILMRRASTAASTAGAAAPSDDERKRQASENARLAALALNSTAPPASYCKPAAAPPDEGKAAVPACAGAEVEDLVEDCCTQLGGSP